MNEPAQPGRAPDPLHALCLADPVWAERYEGWTELGHGGSATVVRTRSRATEEDLALKIFTRLDDDGRRRFQQEARHNQRLASPYVVRTHSPFLRTGLAWIEMEWVDGPDLRHELRRRERERTPFGAVEARRIGAAVARALVAAHEAGVIHRDVKPANVLLPRSGRPVAKLGDFGISRVAGAARVTATGFIAGTPQFVAPEVIAGQPADARSDVYSLGLTLYLLFSGNRFPFDVATDDAPARWLEAHARLFPRPLRALVPDADPALEALFARALSKDPAERPTAAEFAATLEALPLAAADAPTPPAGARTERIEPAVEPPPTIVTRERRTHARRWAAALVALVAAAAGWGLWRARPRPSLPASVPSPAPMSARAAPTVSPPPASPAPTPSPTATPVDLAAGLEVRLAGTPDAPLLVLANGGRAPLPPLDLALVGDGGATGRTRMAAPLAPGAELWVALDSFAPAPPPEWRARRVELALDDGRRVTLPLGPR
jgi:serine/threonine-protein kinase